MTEHTLQFVAERVTAIFAAEEAIRRANAEGGDEAAVRKMIRAAIRTHFRPGYMPWRFSSNFGTEKAKTQFALFRRRILFKLVPYQHGIWDEFWMAYASGDMDWTLGYSTRFGVAAIEGELKLVASQRVCVTCRGTGGVDGGQCARCGGGGWLLPWFQGWESKEMSQLGKPKGPAGRFADPPTDGTSIHGLHALES